MTNTTRLGYFIIFDEQFSTALTCTKRFCSFQNLLCAVTLVCVHFEDVHTAFQILYAKDTDQRSSTFEKSFAMGKEYQRRTKVSPGSICHLMSDFFSFQFSLSVMKGYLLLSTTMIPTDFHVKLIKTSFFSEIGLKMSK